MIKLSNKEDECRLAYIAKLKSKGLTKYLHNFTPWFWQEAIVGSPQIKEFREAFYKSKAWDK